MNKFKFAVIGMGHIGKRHAQMIKNNPDAELVAAVDVNTALKEEIETQYGCAYFSSIEELMASDIKIDVINVCTPNGYHAEHAIKALDRNCHVVVEKPMGLTKAACEQVIYKSLQAHKHVFCVMQNRYSPPSAWLKQVLTEERLGKIFMAQINCYWNRDERYYKKGGWKGTLDLDGGPLFTQFSHFLDIMYWLLGDIQDIQARFENFNHAYTPFEDSGSVNFKFINGGIGVLNYSTSMWDKNLESSITIIGEKGSIKVGGQYMDKVEYCHIENYTMPELPPSNPPNDYGAYKGSAANHHYVIENVVDTLKGKTSATTNALEGLKVVEIIERIYALKP
ncbi:MAG: Gfo/Idh/MocA family oxidoreductase [Chitinophagales bacterium]|jgi:predicted dehydrogenase|nr:Gfo/Idh/MocA family oxidoreductase [Chitinophagales bacterium]